MQTSTTPLRRRHLAAAGLVAAALVGLGGVPSESRAETSTAGAPSVVVPVTPFRLLDTRTGVGAGGRTDPLGPDSTITVQVAGVGTIPTDATGVILNVTANAATASGYVTATPTGSARAETSVLNLTPGQDLPNMVTATLGTGGRLDLYNFTGSVHLIADVAGYLIPAGASGSGPAGPQGPIGPQGPAGPSGFAGVHVVVNPYIMAAGATTASADTECPDGEVIVGGGIATFNDDIQIMVNSPLADGDQNGPPTRWIMSAQTYSGQPVAANSSINIRILCAIAP
jgi:hypothetical protein